MNLKLKVDKPISKYHDATLTLIETLISNQMLAKRLSSSYSLFSSPLSSALTRFSSSSSPSSGRVLKAGDILRETRVFRDVDVIEYSKVSHDLNPIHLDEESARNAGFQGRIVHGMLVSSLFPRIIATHFPGAVYASQTLRFKRPVYVGDEIIGLVQVSNIRESNKGYLVKFLTKCIHGRDHHVVLEGEAMAILPSLLIEQMQSMDKLPDFSETFY
ncbi:hypothetical protein Dimus_011511 [Dionaea muscipula]